MVYFNTKIKYLVPMEICLSCFLYLFYHIKTCLNFIRKNYGTSFMPINFVLTYITNTKNIKLPSYLGDKRSTKNKLSKV